MAKADDGDWRNLVSLIVGCVVLMVLANLFEVSVPPQTALTCNDGWESPSIGLRGACSHHHGVMQGTPHDHAVSHNQLTYFFSGIAGLFAAIVTRASFNERDAKLRLAERKAKGIEWEGDKEEVIKKAILWRRSIQFEYQKTREAPLEHRQIKPAKFVNYRRSHGQNQVCVQGYCLTRKAERTFAMERMQNVRIG